MKKYELLCVTKTNLDMEGIEQVIQNIETSIKNLGGNVLNLDKLGRKKLGYEVKKFRDGFYTVLNIELPTDKVVDLKKYLKINEDILRVLITVSTAKEKAA